MKILSLHGPKFDTKRMALAAMLIALQIILEKLSIGDPAVLKIGLGFIATALIGFLLGPWIGALSMIINDLISNTLLSSGAMFFSWFHSISRDFRNNCRDVLISAADQLAANPDL